MKPLHCLLILATVVILVIAAPAQVATGTPPFGSYGGGPFDTVNLGNLNAHFAIPVFSRNGRGTPFYYNFTYDSSIWTQVTSSGVTSWRPVGGWGWQSQTDAATGYIPAPITTTSTCRWFDGQFWHTESVYRYTYSGFVDPLGTFHSTPRLLVIVGSDNCGGSTGSVTKTASDGSGWTVTVPDGIVSSRSGAVWNVPVGSHSGAATITDTNGNKITTSDGVTFYDSLSSQTPVLTISGSAPTVNYTYTSPTGSAKYVMNYSSYNIKTNFGCSGVSEYTGTGIYLASSITLPDQSKYLFTYESTVGSSGYVTGRLASVTLPTGGQVQYGYGDTGTKNTIECADGSAATLTRSLAPGGSWQYTRTGSGSSWTTTVSDPNSNQTVINFTKDSATLNPTQNFYETKRQTPLLTTVTCYNSNGSNCASAAVASPITEKDVTLQYPNSGQQSKTAMFFNSYGLVTSAYKYAYGASAPGGVLQSTTISYATLGNNIVDRPSQVSTYDGSSHLVSQTSYFYDETGYPVQPAGTTPQHQNPSGSRGNVTTITYYSTASATLSTHFQYYDTGTLYKSWDVNGSSTSYAYDQTAQGNTTKSCENSFPTTITTPATPGAPSGLSSKTTWDCNGAVALSATDPNSNSVSTSYSDPDFWRPASVQDQLLNTTNFSYTTPSGTIPASKESKMLFGSSSISERLTTLDSFGRVSLSQQEQGPSSGNYDSMQMTYDNFGRPYQSSMPYVAGAGQGSTTAAVTTKSYDALGRVINVQDGGTGYVGLAYNQNDVLQTNGPAPAGESLKRKQLEYDALGRLISVCEVTAGTTAAPAGTCGQITALPTPGTAYLTRYTYDSYNGQNRVTVTQNAQASSSLQQTRIYLYDLLGRLVSETNPETGNGSPGVTTYTYDSTGATSCGTLNSPGDLLLVSDAHGTSRCYVYDALHRMTDSGFAGSSTGTCTRLRYDNTSGVLGSRPTGVSVRNSLGRVAEAETDTCAAWPINQSSIVTDEWFSYSARGEVTDVYESTIHSGTTYYHVTAGFWANGALNTLSSNIAGLPSQTFGVDGEGRPSSVTASSGQNPVTSTAYDLVNYKTTVTYGSLDSDAFTFDPQTGRMKQYQFNVGSNSDTGTLTWNPNNSLATLKTTDTVTGASDSQTCNYTHDDMARVASANCGSLWNQTFSYDAFGNINKSATIGISFTPGYSATTNQFTSLPGITPTYDVDGRLTYDGANHYTWDVDSKLHTVDTSPSTTVTYDALGRMVEKAVGTTYTQILYGPSGSKLAVMNGQTLLKAFIPLPGGGTAVYTSAGLAYYRHSDHLGSSRLATTPSRTLYSSTAYAPFGEPYAQAGTTDLSFTGQDQDTASGMHDFLARKYTTTSGRWLTPDPAGISAVDPTNPQTWNRYAYVMNNPLSFIDPFGEDCYWEGTCRGVGGLSPLVGGSGGFDPFSTQGIDVVAQTGGNYDDGGSWSWIGDWLVGGGGDNNGPNDYKPWYARNAVLKILDANNDCSKWFNSGTGSAHDIMSNVPILLGNPSSGSLPGPDASTFAGPAGPITIAPDERFYPIQYSKNGLPIGGAYQPGSYGARMTILLHELAHKVNLIPNDGPLSEGPSNQSDINTQNVMTHCQSAVDSGTY